MVTAAPAGNREPAPTTVASPAVSVSSAQRLFQQEHMPKQTPFRRKPPNLPLTISKGGDVSQILSTDLCDILHHEDLPGQLIQEVSCHKWCFTGEHNLLVKTNEKELLNQKKTPKNLRRKQKTPKHPAPEEVQWQIHRLEPQDLLNFKSFLSLGYFMVLVDRHCCLYLLHLHPEPGT